MFQIDRSYINLNSMETLQGHIWDLRTDHRNDPTLPQLQHYGIESEEAFEAYLEKRQKFEDFKDSWRQYKLLILGTAFVVPVALFSLLVRDSHLSMYAYLIAFTLCLLIYLGFLTIKSARERQFKNNPYETFIKALLSWEENHARY